MGNSKESNQSAGSGSTVESRAINILKSNYNFRFNVITGFIELKGTDSIEFQKLDDRTLNTIWLKILFDKYIFVFILRICLSKVLTHM